MGPSLVSSNLNAKQLRFHGVHPIHLTLVQLKYYILICISTLDNDNEDSQKMLRHLELIDDEAAEYEVKMVKIDDPLMAKKYGHREPPGLGFFRQGNFIKYEGNPCLKTQYF